MKNDLQLNEATHFILNWKKCQWNQRMTHLLAKYFLSVLLFCCHELGHQNRVRRMYVPIDRDQHLCLSELACQNRRMFHGWKSMQFHDFCDSFCSNNRAVEAMQLVSLPFLSFHSCLNSECYSSSVPPEFCFCNFIISFNLLSMERLAINEMKCEWQSKINVCYDSFNRLIHSFSMTIEQQQSILFNYSLDCVIVLSLRFIRFYLLSSIHWFIWGHTLRKKITHFCDVLLWIQNNAWKQF